MQIGAKLFWEMLAKGHAVGDTVLPINKAYQNSYLEAKEGPNSLHLLLGSENISFTYVGDAASRACYALCSTALRNRSALTSISTAKTSQ
jgi:hypothetical protein